MKKIFTLIGIMTVIFSVYFMLLVVDKSNYLVESRISDFSLSKQINLETLEECAKESNVCVQIRAFNNYSFGNTDCKVEVINPAKNVKYGAVRSLFPNRHMKIIKAQKFLFCIIESANGNIYIKLVTAHIFFEFLLIIPNKIFNKIVDITKLNVAKSYPFLTNG